MNILVIEDEPDIRKNLEYNLSREGFTVTTSSSLSEAESILNSNKFSLILLDLMLPDGSGLDLCKKMKSNPETDAIPIIILTAKDDEVDKVVGFELGADDYVTKPFSIRELILRVKVLQKKQSENIDSDKLLEIGQISMDLDAHSVSIDKKQIILTALEFKLLKHLAQRKGRVQTRDQLLGDVWGYSSEVTTRTVDTHIKRLREKLGSACNYIQTIRGVGYRFNVSNQ